MDLDITEVIEKSQNTRREELIECRRHRPVSSASWRAQLRGSFWAVPSAQQQSPPAPAGIHRLAPHGRREEGPARQGPRGSPDASLTGEAGEAPAGPPCPTRRGGQLFAPGPGGPQRGSATDISRVTRGVEPPACVGRRARLPGRVPAPAPQAGSRQPRTRGEASRRGPARARGCARPGPGLRVTLREG